MSFHAVFPLLKTARARYLDVLKGLEEDQLTWRLAPGSNSIGFLIQHNAEVEYRFCAMFFGRPLPEGMSLPTIGSDVRDTGSYTDLADLFAFQEAAHAYLLETLQALPEEKWHVPVDAPIGRLTPTEAVGRLIYHTGYHGGQIGLIRKYGNRA
ncbi:DinB family protein [Brevibacillus sp. SYP-B805]|uniref:DinB family protein n=1 Tax=Brevibacillus sp. SYP-B805 TaxID=1578199 RepID=UPI0013EAAAA2|nr:DinB family protein [Brevibacillus sp. SYP-B805]NGQ96678.1 DinB family protein [Brevibacillus sp. SYP-B805]